LQSVAVCCSLLLCVAVCCCVLQSVAVCCSLLLCVAVCCCVLQSVAVCCNLLLCVAVCCCVLQSVAVCCSLLLCVAVCCCVLQSVAVCCSLSLCVAICCSCRPEFKTSFTLTTLQHTPAHCGTLQHTVTHCNTLQHVAKHRTFSSCVADMYSRASFIRITLATLLYTESTVLFSCCNVTCPSDGLSSLTPFSHSLHVLKQHAQSNMHKHTSEACQEARHVKKRGMSRSEACQEARHVKKRGISSTSTSNMHKDTCTNIHTCTRAVRAGMSEGST